MVRLAIVDDDCELIELVRATAALHGWQVQSYNRADWTLALLRRTLPDLIILDLRLERADAGWQLFELLCLDPVVHRIPVIVCSADAVQPGQRSERMRSCGASVLLKPFDLEELESLIRLSRHPHMQERAENTG